ncbi:MAG: Uma2 family endonuclease, partial [Oscillatoriales cyanobacterium SM2_2_1]|nr:Uma2 family endonuclease [Oscillatoriales cyanobacterium SM2_2_1]
AMAQPTGIHGGISEFINDAFRSEIKRLSLPLVSKQELIAVQTTFISSKITCRIPDVTVISVEQWEAIKFSEAVLNETAPLLVVEVVSDTSRNIDYRKKRIEYNAIEIPEYWIVDYSESKISVLSLKNDLYEEVIYTDQNEIQSQLFPELIMIPRRIFTI